MHNIIKTEKNENNIKLVFFGKNGGVSEDLKFGGPDGLNTARNSESNQENITKNEEIIKNQFLNPEKITLCPVRSEYSNKIAIINEIRNNTICISSHKTDDQSNNIIKTTEEIQVNNSDCIHADAIITSIPNALLTIQTADAIPILLYDSKKNVIGAASCPYHSLKKDILKQIISVMIEMDCLAENIKANIGPGRRKESYEVTKEFKDEWLKTHSCHEDFFGETYNNEKNCKFDMAGIEKKQLIDSGIKEDNIYDCGIDVGLEENFKHYHTYREMLKHHIIKPNEKFGLNTSAIIIYEKSDSINSINKSIK